jgi:hypothetical protein
MASGSGHSHGAPDHPRTNGNAFAIGIVKYSPIEMTGNISLPDVVLRRVGNLLRASIALALVTAIVAFLSVPVCSSSACPMSGTERAACKAMGRECCGTKGGQVSHTPALSAPAVAITLARVTIGDRAAEGPAVADPSRVLAVPAMVQGVGLFTLFAVFLI